MTEYSTMELLLGPLFVSVLLEVGTAEGLPVLNNTDFPSNCGNDPYHPSTGIQECGRFDGTNLAGSIWDAIESKR